MPTAHTSISTEKTITPPAPAWALPTLNDPLTITATRSPPPIRTAIAAAIFSDQGRSPGSSGVSVARTAALRASDRLAGLPSGGGGTVVTVASSGGREAVV